MDDVGVTKCGEDDVHWFARVRSYVSWSKTSLAVLAKVEQKILSCLTNTPVCCYVNLDRSPCRIWTLSMNAKAKAIPLVLLHGMGSGIGLWILNLDALAHSRPLYAIDLLGFGRSSRVQFSDDPVIAEHQFVESIEQWRQAVGIDSMILLGHSLGGYLAASYALSYGSRVKHLILVDPWGFPERPATQQLRREIPMWMQIVRGIIQPFNPFSAIRLAGPWGPSLIARFRPDLLQKYSCFFSDDVIAEYIYHCNAQKPSGEVAFKTLNEYFGWAKRPMIHRVSNIPQHVSMTFIHGSDSWIDAIGHEIKYIRRNSFVDVKVVRGAGHHIYADKPELFNVIVNQICGAADHHLGAVHQQSTAMKDCNANDINGAELQGAN